MYSAKSGAITGSIRGVSTTISAAFESRGFSKTASYIIKELTYYGTTFALETSSNYARALEYNPTAPLLEAMTLAAVETGKRLVDEVFGFNFLSSILTTASTTLEKNNWPTMAKGLKYAGFVARYGVFAKMPIQQALLVLLQALQQVWLQKNVVEFTGKMVLKEMATAPVLSS